MTEQSNFYCGSNDKRRDRGVREKKEREGKNGEFSYASLKDGDK